MQLRIEDTDTERNQTGSIEGIKADLAWLGLDWQGDETGNPWRQSQRLPQYEVLFNTLKEKTYPCFCSDSTLKAERIKQQAAGKPPRYSGTCSTLPPTEAKRRIDSGEPHTWRFRVPRQAVRFNDLIHGPLSFNSQDFGDFIIRRADGSFPFLFTNAADDALCGVTDVIRGDDHLSNTPRQILLLQALNRPPPRYGHLPLIINDSGRPLSKRDGLTSVSVWREQGFLPLALNNHLARTGHRYPPQIDRTLHPLPALAEHFNENALSKSAARHDETHLRHWQKETVLSLPENELSQWLGAEATAGIPAAAGWTRALQENILFPQEAIDWRNLLTADLPPPTAEARRILAATPSPLLTAAAAQAETDDWPTFSQAIKAATGLTGKALYLPLRAALTGRTDGPNLPEIYTRIGKTRRQNRLRQAAQAPSPSQ